MDATDWENYIDRIIRDAMKDGAFDNLRGQGSPFPREDENPFEEDDRRLAHHLLRSNGFTVPWIATRQDIFARRERLAVPLLRTWRVFQARVSFRPEDALAHDLWRRARERFQEDVALLNRQIDDYNLMVPSDAFRLLPINAEKEMSRLVAEEE